MMSKAVLFALAIVLIVLGILWIIYPEWFKIDKKKEEDKNKLYALYGGSAVMIVAGLFAGWKGYKMPKPQ